MKATDPIAILVGADAYVAAGGRIERELFSEDGDRWTDPELAQTLAASLLACLLLASSPVRNLCRNTRPYIEPGENFDVENSTQLLISTPFP